MSTKGLEIEYKYLGDTVKLSDFITFCESLKPLKSFQVSGFDFFYAKSTDPNEFYRIRINMNEFQLTFKKKLALDNNFVRIEHNITLYPDTDRASIENYVKDLGYHPSAMIFKSCFIYNYETYTLVYYIVYDADMKELGRFIEIEMKEDHTWKSIEEAVASMGVIEEMAEVIGVYPCNRVPESLFELFRTDLTA